MDRPDPGVTGEVVPAEQPVVMGEVVLVEQPAVTWTVDPAERSAVLHSAVAMAEHCLRLWSEFSAAATPDALPVSVAVGGHSGVVARLDGPGTRVEVTVPLDLLREGSGQLAALLIEAVIPAVVAHAEQHPRPEPAVVWETGMSFEPLEPDDDSPLILELETLEADDVLVIGRLDGTPDDEHTRGHGIGDHVNRALREAGWVGGADDFSAGSLVYWSVHPARE